MKLLSLLSIYTFFPLFLLGQSSENVQALLKNKMTIQTSRAFYLKNTRLSRHFINRYVNLTKSFKIHKIFSAKNHKGYRSEDTLIAYRQIKIINKTGQKAFYQLMQTRLQWDYKEHLQKFLLDSAKLNLQNHSDSAYYFFMLGMHSKDSMNELLARKLGFVMSDNKGNELVDWKKMNSIKFTHWVMIELIGSDSHINSSMERIRNAFIPYLEKAIKLDKKEFFYMIEMLLPLIRLGDEKTIQEKIILYKNNYSNSQQKWLASRTKESIIRQQEIPELKEIK